MTNSIQETLTSTDVKRRSVIKGAAWSVPVIAAAVATPLAAASDGPPKDATRYGTSSNTVPGGTSAYFSAFGVDDDDNDAKLPAGTTITFTISPAAAVGTLSITTGNASMTGPVNGVYTLIPVAGATRVKLKGNFPSGTTAKLVISGSLGTNSSDGGWS